MSHILLQILIMSAVHLLFITTPIVAYKPLCETESNLNCKVMTQINRMKTEAYRLRINIRTVCAHVIDNTSLLQFQKINISSAKENVL